MSIPNNALSQTTQRSTWYGLDTLDPTDTLDYEEGGIDLNDTSKGLEYQLWTFFYVDTAVYAYSDYTGNVHLFDSVASIDRVRGTFDQNMNFFVAYRSADQWKYRWYDTLSGDYTTSDMPTGVTSCVCTLDDKRKLENSTSDILLLYTLDDNLYYRQQRDRYQTEYLLRTGIGGELIKCGMNDKARIQIKLRVV